MKANTRPKAFTNTNYNSNYNEIFENNGLKLVGQILPNDKLNIQLDSKLLSETD